MVEFTRDHVGVGEYVTDGEAVGERGRLAGRVGVGEVVAEVLGGRSARHAVLIVPYLREALHAASAAMHTP